MEKSILHRKAEHPSLIISLLLLAGILLGPYFVLSKLALTSLLLLSWGALVLMNVLIKNHLSKSLFSIICILFWGFCIVQFQQNTDGHSLLDKLEKYIQPIRDIILHKIDLYIKNNSNSQFVKALLIGEKNNIDPETLEAYTALGIVHIIAISGMHLDIIAQYLTKITGWLPKNKYWQLMELLFLTIAIITYSLVAHASPSIIRAALFFCLYTMGAYFNLHRYMLNIIASGLLIIILFDYQSITHIGWQLSYAAVLGIHFVHPIISNWLTLKNPIIQIIWNNFSITVSTQISTLPLLLYYFHTVSTGIILGNMVMIPLSNLLLEALIILLLLPAFWVKLFHWGEIIEIYMQKTSQLVHYIFTISPQPLYFTSISINYLLVYYTIFLYLCLWKKRYNQPLFRFSTKTA
jgi:competence protein ComEC